MSHLRVVYTRNGNSRYLQNKNGDWIEPKDVEMVNGALKIIMVKKLQLEKLKK